jgi:UDP-N-acetylmuramoyl-L-alanyl-D-glutamate--2,6-diaminopimelate ligase
MTTAVEVDTIVTTRTMGELLADLLPPAELAAVADREVVGVFDDSRRVVPGSIFVAVKGTRVDGRRFVEYALERGAAAVVGEELPPSPRAVVVNVPDARAALATLALRWHGLATDGSGGLTLVGVTGTNGKSTTAFMARAILGAAGLRCALLGTVYNDLGGRSVPAEMTTPGPLELAAHLREMVDAGAQAAVLEISSHALHQKRTDGLVLRAAAFTNLTGDHLDYHGTFEDYRAAKARLFELLPADAVAVVNQDDPAHAAMIANTKARVVTYAIDQPADLTAQVMDSTTAGTTFLLHCEGETLRLENALVGRHNVYNALAAVGLARAVGADFEAIRQGLRGLRNVPGRLQRVPCACDADVFVDYAHTDDALENVLSVLRPLTRGQLILVFGCGGDRDRTKRSRMAAVASRYADQVFVTNDNPRTEDPRAIAEQIFRGFDADARRRVVVELDRAEAIAAALSASAAEDVVLIAGKGHENYQIIGTRRIHFDDVETAIQAAAEIQRFWHGEAPS